MGRFEDRAYQDDAVAKLRDNFRNGLRAQLLVMPTGAGKTATASKIIAAALRKGNRILFLAHRKELIDQCSKTLDEFGVDHGIIKGKHWRNRPDLPVQVASVQTLIRRARPDAHVVILDEAHRALNATNTTIVGWYPDALKLGLTATPWRLDGRGLGALYQAIVAPITMQEAIDARYLLPLRIYEPERPDLKGLARTGGDYNQKQLGKRLKENPKRIGNIVQHWKDLGEGQRTVVFAVNVADSREIVRQFVEAGIAAEHLDGDTNETDRDAILARLASGATQVVSNVDVLVEGYDLPSLGCVVLAKPTLSLTRFLQMVGRGMRPYGEQRYCIVLDHAGCVHRHRDPTEDRHWSLEDRVRRDEDADRPSPITCEACKLVRAANILHCPLCVPAEPREGGLAGWFDDLPIEAEGRLVERLRKPNEMRCKPCGSDQVFFQHHDDLRVRLDCYACGKTSYQPDPVAVRQASEARRREEFNRLERVREQKQFKQRWVDYAYRDIFGSFPPPEWQQAGP